MEDQPLVTIVTPSFNQVKFLPATYSSVISQNYPNIEYFIVDGSSTDGSMELIRSWAEEKNSRLGWWISEKDDGQADAINKGFSRAKGEIIAWLNSDDIYMRGAVEKAVQTFNANPDVGLIFSNVFSIDSDSKLINVMRFKEWSLKDLMAFNIIGQAGVFMRKKALDDSGYLDSSYHYLLDHQLWLRIAENYKIKYVDDYFAAARFHSEAKNISQAVEFSQEAFRIVNWMKSQPELESIFKTYRRKILSGAYRFSARYLLDGGNNRESFNHYLKSFWYNPPTAMQEFSRITYAFLSFIPFVKNMKATYLQKRSAQLEKNNLNKIYEELSDYNSVYEYGKQKPEDAK
jgi:glycosyltransferase involved in cell wall biosynthesis